MASGQGNDYTAGFLLDYNYFKKHYKIIAVDLSKEQALNADQKAIQQNNLSGSLSGNNKRLIFFIIEEANETILDFPPGKYCECR